MATFWLLTTGEPPPFANGRSMRTGLLARTLIRDGHTVHWWSTSFDHQTKQYLTTRSESRVVSDRYIYRMLHSGVSYKRNVSVRRLINHSMVAAEFTRQAASEIPPCAVICSYPTLDMSEAAVRYCAAKKVPIILDVRDLWPDIFASEFPSIIRNIGAHRFLLAPLYRKKVRILQGVGAITAISDEYIKWALDAIPHRKKVPNGVFPIGCERSTWIDKFRSQRVRLREEMGFSRDDVVVWFSGTFGRTYDLGCVIRVARQFLASNRSVKFLLCGDGEMRTTWAAEAQGLSNVVFAGWLDEVALARCASTADVGLLAYRMGAPQSLPNKLFEYMSIGIPLVSSLTGESRTIIENNAIGRFYKADSSSELYSVLQYFVGSPEVRQEMGGAALRVFFRNYEAGFVYEKFAQFIYNVVGSSGTAV